MFFNFIMYFLQSEQVNIIFTLFLFFIYVAMWMWEEIGTLLN